MPLLAQHNRVATATWDLTTEGTETKQVCLTVYHYGKAEYHGLPEKCFLASLRRQTQIDLGGGMSMIKTRYGLGEPGVELGSQPVARYDAKKQMAFLEEMVEKVCRLRTSKGPVSDLFAPA